MCNNSDSDNSAMYNIETVEGMGRVLVAARDIHPWELVIDDTCLVLAPNNYPVCLGCLGEVLSLFSYFHWMFSMC